MSDMGTGPSGRPRWLDWTGRLTFQVKLALLVSLIILFLIVGTAFLVDQRQRSAIVQEVEKRALVMAQALASGVADDLVTYNYVAIEQSVKKFSAGPDLVYIFVYDKEGNIAAQFIRDQPLRQILQRPRTLKPGEAIVDQVHVPGTERETVYDIRLPVVVEGSANPWGMIRLGVSLLSMHQEIARTRWQIAGFVLVGLLGGIMASAILARRLSRPIQALMDGVAAVGRGDFGRRIEVTSQDELGRLSAAFNEMSTQLARVRDLEERLRRADRLAALGTMAAGIAHDIRNPLTSILIFSQLMSLHHDDPDVREKFNRVVPRELERVQAVIEDMMELARPATMHRELVSINELLTQVLELYEGQASGQSIKIVREYDQDLPFCMADRKRLHRCFSNIVSNAIQAMPNGGDLSLRSSQASTTLLPKSGQPEPRTEPAVEVAISDTGQGIPADRLSRIFDPFFTTKEKGMGLGMAITHRIVEDHKGNIEVQSEEGLGTTFTVHLPLSA
jgi:signal transduction histidine kinase